MAISGFDEAGVEWDGDVYLEVDDDGDVHGNGAGLSARSHRRQSRCCMSKWEYRLPQSDHVATSR